MDFDIEGARTVFQQPAQAAEQGTTPTANHVALPVGSALQEYTIEAVLGAGGFGIT